MTDFNQNLILNVLTEEGNQIFKVKVIELAQYNFINIFEGLKFNYYCFHLLQILFHKIGLIVTTTQF